MWQKVYHVTPGVIYFSVPPFRAFQTLSYHSSRASLRYLAWHNMDTSTSSNTNRSFATDKNCSVNQSTDSVVTDKNSSDEDQDHSYYCEFCTHRGIGHLHEVSRIPHFIISIPIYPYDFENMVGQRIVPDEEDWAEVEVLRARLEKTIQLTKKIKTSQANLESSGRNVRHAINPIYGNTQSLQVTGTSKWTPENWIAQFFSDHHFRYRQCQWCS